VSHVATDLTVDDAEGNVRTGARLVAAEITLELAEYEALPAFDVRSGRKIEGVARVQIGDCLGVRLFVAGGELRVNGVQCSRRGR
jgi:hypothetical protein